ncbi:MAG: amino acid ABC transporter substrate-binding protein [Clostridia bacterium]|nr:amino acid ABC transporter substrate-binding protein [Clostridia bacterium]
MKKLFSLILSVVMLVTVFAGCSAKKEDNKFIVGFDSEFPPMGFIADDGKYVGFDLDLAEEVAKRLGLEFVAQPIAWDSKDTELASGNIDCIWNGFTITGREDKYTWTEPYMANAQVIVVRNGSDIKSVADLAGKVVCVQKDSSGLAAVEENEDLSNSIAELVQVESYLNSIMELESGAVDAIVMDEIVARYELSNSDADLVVLDVQVSTEEYGVGFLLGNEKLRDDVQKTLKEMAADGTLASISNKWFGKDITIIK